MAGKKQAYVLVRDWLPDAKPVDRDEALGEFARRYLVGHGPATDRDLARWAGIPLRDARAGLSAAGEAGAAAVGEAAELPPPRLLGSFEPCLLGWTSRTDIVGENPPNLVTVGGMFYPFAMVRGRAVARWKLRDGGLELEPVQADLEGRPRRAGARRRGRRALPRLASRPWSSQSTPPATARSGTRTPRTGSSTRASAGPATRHGGAAGRCPRRRCASCRT